MAKHDRSSTPPAAARLRHAGTPLDQLEMTLRLLCTGPNPLAVDGRRLGHGLPRRRIALDELAAVLAHPSTSQAAKRAVWALLVTRARGGEPGWVVGTAGVALPGLRRAAARLPQADRADVEADLLEGFLTALATVETNRPGICGRLCNAAHALARARLRAEHATASGQGHFAAVSMLPPAPYGHPDLVLARAVRAGVLTAAEADLIGVTRLELVGIADYARRVGWSRWAAYTRRNIAETKLAEAIRTGQLADPDREVITEATRTVAAPRQHVARRDRTDD
jgi:hypothetical protein